MGVFRQLPLESFPPFKRSSSDLVGDAVAAAEGFKGFLLGEDWDQLHSHSATLVGIADLLLRRIHAFSALEDAWGKSLSERDSVLRSAFAELSTDASAEADEIRAVMLTQLEELSGEADEAQAFLDHLLAGEAALFSSRALAKSVASSEQKALVTPQVLSASLANRAAVESSLFKAHERVKTAGAASAGNVDTEIVEAESQALRVLHDETAQSLLDALGSDAGKDDFVTLCVARQAWIAARLPTSAMLLGGYLALEADDDDGTTPVEQYRTALTATEWIRRLSLLHAYVSLMRAEAATVDPGRWYSNEQRRVTTRVAESQVPSGQEARISDLHEGQLEDGSFVELEGRAEKLAIRDDPSPPKFSTFFNMVDVTSGVSVLVRAHMFSLINNGLTNGAYVRLSGHLRMAPSWTDDIGVDIDRVSLTELRRSSWYDDMTHRVGMYASLYPDEMNMFFTPPFSE